MFNTHGGTRGLPHASAASPARNVFTTRMFSTDTAALLLMVAAAFMMLARALWGVSGEPVTSDESLYLSEAVSIAQGRFEYASGDAITHRPPLYPVVLAPIMAASGQSIEAARIVPIACALGALAALYWLGRLTGGHRAACAGVALAALAAGPSQLSTGFFVDTPAAMWLFASAAALIMAKRSPARATNWCICSGALLALSFLTKETAAIWLSVPLGFALVSRARSIDRRALFSFYATFTALVAPWFAWVAYHAETAYKLDAAPVASVLAASILLGAVAFAGIRAGWLRNDRGREAAGVVTLVAWAAAMFLVLESRAEPHSRDYLAAVSDWTAHVLATNVEPWAFVAAAWAYACWRLIGYRGDALAPLILAAAGTPLYVFVANQGWELRQLIWLVYLSYLALGWMTLDGISRVANGWRPFERDAFAFGCVIALGLVAGFASQAGAGAGAETARNWRNPDEREIARWLDDLPDGATVLSSRLYHSQLYVDSGGRIAVRQLPTLGVTIGSDGAIAPFGTLFRYDDADLTVQRHWISIEKYSGRPYAIALAEEDLLGEFSRHGATHVLLTGEDAGFSSLSYRGYFDGNAAFTLVRSSSVSGAVLYAVHRDALQPRNAPLSAGAEDLAYLMHQAGRESERAEYWEATAPAGILLDGERLLDAQQVADRARQLREEHERESR